LPMQLLSVANPAGGATTVFGEGTVGKVAFDYFVDALETNNLLRVLAEPNVITTSGQKASFMAGGQIPIPVPQSSGSGTVITIDYKNYGVQLNFTPIVLGDGRIRLEVNPDVSQLDYSHTVNISGTEVPGITDRNVNTTVELAEGQTFTIAGLLQDNITTTNQEFPLLGDLPVLGALFRSVNYQRSETELVVMVTPVLVHGVDPADVTRAPGEKWRQPTEGGLFLMKDMGGEQLNPDGSATKGPAPEYHGPVGFNPVVSSADFH
jgi:pilus assembly protein CpaC